MNDPFGRVRLPGDFSREGRVRLLGEVCQALFEGRLPSREGALYVAGAIAGWLAGGGDLERDFLKVSAPRGSHRRPEVVWRELVEETLIDDEGQDPEDRED